jgi:copper chaperone
MKTISFRTNIRSKEEVNKLKPYLDSINGISDWNINTDEAGKILTVKLDGADSKVVAQTIFKAGFRSEEIIPAWKKVLKKTFTRDCCS